MHNLANSHTQFHLDPTIKHLIAGQCTVQAGGGSAGS